MYIKCYETLPPTIRRECQQKIQLGWETKVDLQNRSHPASFSLPFFLRLPPISSLSLSLPSLSHSQACLVSAAFGQRELIDLGISVDEQVPPPFSLVVYHHLLNVVVVVEGNLLGNHGEYSGTAVSCKHYL